MIAECRFLLNDFILSPLLNVNNRTLLSGSENALQKAFSGLDKIINGYNLSTSTEKSKLPVIAFSWYAADKRDKIML